MLHLSDFLILACFLFGLGLIGIVINRRNIIVMLMSLELMLLGVNTNFIAFSHWQQNYIGQIMVFFIVTVTTAEAAIGLAIMVLLYKKQRSLALDDWHTLQG